MKKIFFLAFLLALTSCDDGDITIESVDFDAVNLDFCDNKEDVTETTFFFKIEDDEALLLTLTSGLIENTTVVDPITANISATAAPSLTYRLFTGDVSQSYFCDAIPPLQPTVIQENTATGGKISIVTNVASVTEALKNYNHAITIEDLSLTNEQGERLTETAVLNYGNFIAPVPNSPNLEVPFSNYEATAIALCDTPPSEGNIRLYKLLNDEYVHLDIPSALLGNTPTEEDMPRIDSLKNTTVFRNVVLDTVVSQEMACSIDLPEGNLVGDFVTSSGIVSVSTVAGSSNAQGETTYTHTITLDGFRLTLNAIDEDSSDVNLDEIPTYTFGTVTTVAN